MVKIFRDRTIEKRVMTVVSNAIEQAQKEHDEEVQRAEEELERTIEAANNAHETRLIEIADAGVKKVFSRLV